MILRRCSRGCEPTGEPLTWTVSAWNRADGQRVAYKQKLCLTCVASHLAPLYTACQEPTMKCPNCGIDTSDDMDPVYVSFIPKGVGMLKADAPFCGACAARYRVFAQEGGEKLDDRQPQGEGPGSGPSPTASQVWASLGLRPAQ